MAETYPIVKKLYEISEIVDETKEVVLIRFKPDDGTGMKFDAGMFAMVSGVDKNDGHEWLAKALSIASEPESQIMEFFIIKQHGTPVHVSHFWQSSVGDKYYIKGPNGQFKFTPGVDKKVLFIAGGTGLAPFMSMIRHIKKVGAQDDMVLLYSVKYPTEIIRKEELYSYQSSLNLKLTVSVTRPAEGDGWTGQTGHIDAEMIKKYAADYMDRTVYICGPLEFVKAMKEALATLNVPAQKIKADVWG